MAAPFDPDNATEEFAEVFAKRDEESLRRGWLRQGIP
jgi:hypothetical protein